MKNSRFKSEYRRSASNLHKAVGELLKSSPLTQYHKIYQEYPVNLVNEYYPDSSHKFDWVIPSLRIVIEVHGKQHYDVVDFGGEGVEKAIEAFKNGLSRDSKKREAALAVRYTYIVIPYNEILELSEDYLLEKISIAEKELERYTIASDGVNIFEEIDSRDEYVGLLKEKKKEQTREVRQRYLSSDSHMEKLERAKQYRKERYRYLKELKKDE